MKSPILIFLCMYWFAAAGQLYSTGAARNLSLYYGQTFRFGNERYHSFEIADENVSHGCTGTCYKGFALRYDHYAGKDFAASVRAFHSVPVWWFSGIAIPYIGVSPVFFNINGAGGLNIKPEAGLKFGLPVLTRRQLINAGITISYGYEVPLINKDHFTVGRNDLYIRVGLWLDLNQVRYRIRKKKEAEEVSPDN